MKLRQQLTKKDLKKQSIKQILKNLKKLEVDVGFLEKQNRNVNFFSQGVENNWKKILPRDITVEIEKNLKMK